MTKAKAYYEAYLVLQCLSKKEYSLIPKKLLDEITTNMEKDNSIKVDPNIPLEKQKLNEKTYDILDRVITAIERQYGKDAIDHPEDVVVVEEKPPEEPAVEEIEIDDFTAPTPKIDYSKENDPKKLKDENIRLKSIIESLKAENEKVGKAKSLVIDYQELVTKKDAEIAKLKEDVEKLQKDNEDLYNSIQRTPKLFRRIFFKDNIKMLKG